MSTLCSDSVLTGQEGTITFKPPGTSVCVRDWAPFTSTRIYMPCGARYVVGDRVAFVEEDGGNLDGSYTATPKADLMSAIGSLGDLSDGLGYADGVYELPLTGGKGNGATAKITVTSGQVTDVEIVKAGSGYEEGDVVTAAVPGGGTGFSVEIGSLNVAPMTVTEYYVVAVGVGAGADQDAAGVSMVGIPYISVSATEGGTAITAAGDGGTGTANNPLPAHINIQLSEYQSVCGVREFAIEISRDELDITTLPCVDSGDTDGCMELAEFRKTQSGYATATGTMTVYFSCDQTNIANRLLQSSILKSQEGAKVRLYVCAKYSGGELDNTDSLYVDADITITGMSFSVNPDDPTTGELSFSVRKMNSIFGLSA